MATTEMNALVESLYYDSNVPVTFPMINKQITEPCSSVIIYMSCKVNLHYQKQLKAPCEELQ